MPNTATALASETSGVHVGTTYTLQGFIKASGISYHRIRLAVRDGVELPTLRVGRRSFVRGADGIAYIERLAELSKAKA